MRKLKIPGAQNGSADVYKKSPTRTRESKFRDVYTPRDVKRSNAKEITSFTPAKVATALMSMALFVGLWALAGGVVWLYNSAVTFMHPELQNVAYMACVKYAVGHFPWNVIVVALWTVLTLTLYLYMKDSWRMENISTDNSDINDYDNDAALQTPTELPYNYDFVPDVFGHYDGDVTAILSHMHFKNKGLHNWPNGLPIFDIKFSDKLYASDGVPEDKALRVRYDATQIAYNPGGKIHGKANFESVADVINKTWTLPKYEGGRPGGVYIADTSPSNTMVIASTRAGKGQTYIEPIIDVWTRAKEQQNVVINDPKGELYVKFFYPMRKRGMDTIVFNLMDSTHTNIYNPLGYAVQAARQGDYGKMEDFINNVGNVFFPTEGADDPMWPNAAAATFKRSALGLIDYYMEEEAEMRSRSVREKWSADLLARRLDVMWGRVTLYNIYQMMVSLASKKSSDESLIKFDDDTDVEEKDYLSLFFDATERLPQNPLRQAAINNNRTLRTMAGSDKTIASVYGIAMSTMLFFTDDKIARLTSGRPSQNFDMEGLSFPRRIGVRFDTDYTLKHGLNSQVIRWQVYEDADFKQPYKGKDFSHNGTIVNGWARATFKGKFKHDKTYLKLTILDRDTVNKKNPLRIGTYFFEFKKSFERGLSGTTYVKDPVTNEFVVKDGNLIELARIRDKKTGKIRYAKKTSLIKFTRKSLQSSTQGTDIVDKKPLFQMVDVHYTERTKGIFLVTPPSKMQYSKLILIMLSQSFDINVDASYMTKENQKPLYKTKYILDEFGNLQSEGKGIPFLQTKESIGLGQEQQYTLILQTLQQLRDVYGDSIDKILQGNTANIVYLKSNDASMLDTLIELGGVRHESRRSSKSVTEHAKKLFADVEDSVSYTTSTNEVPVIQKNDMLFIQQGNNMVFRLGENPLWSKNQLAMPFAYALHSKLFPESPDYSLMTVPTPSNTDDFDILGNIPDWISMVEKRVRQARIAQEMTTRYESVYNLGPDGMQRLDPELVSIELMVAINEQLHLEDRQQEIKDQDDAEAQRRYTEHRDEWEVDPDDIDFSANDFPEPNEDFDEGFPYGDVEDLSHSADMHEAIMKPESNKKALSEGSKLVENSTQNEVLLGDRNVGNAVTRGEFINNGNAYDDIISRAYDITRNQFQNAHNEGFQIDDRGNLFHNNIRFITNVADDLENFAKKDNVNVVEDDSTDNPDVKWEATHDFKLWLIKGTNARDLLDGKFLRELRKEFVKKYGN